MPQAETAEKSMIPGSLLPIRTVANLTGVNPVTLRAWERRYNLVTPQRTPKGHRLYTEEDVELIRQVLDLLDQGIAISQVKPLLERATDADKAASLASTGDVWKNYQQKMLHAVEIFDEHALDSSYNDALSLYPVDVVNQRLIFPLLRLLGERWDRTRRRYRRRALFFGLPAQQAGYPHSPHEPAQQRPPAAARLPAG